MLQAKKKVTPQWFAYVPGEIRNNVYEQYFSSICVSVATGFRGGRRSPREVRMAPLNLFLVSRRIKAEAEPFFWQMTLFKYYGSHSWGPPSPDQVNKIQSLWLSGYSHTARILKLALPMSLDSEPTVRSLEIGRELDLHCDSNILRETIEHCKNRIGLLSLTLNTLSLAVIANLDVIPRDPLLKEHSCKVTIRNTYDIFIESRYRPSIEAVTLWLEMIYDEDFEKATLTTST